MTLVFDCETSISFFKIDKNTTLVLYPYTVFINENKYIVILLIATIFLITLLLALFYPV